MKAHHTLLMIFFVIPLLMACAGRLVPPIPSWTMNPPTLTTEGLSVVGVSYPSASERGARESALEGALSEFLRYTGVEVNIYIKMITREKSTDSSPTHVAIDNTDSISLATQGFVQKVRKLVWHLERDTDGDFIAYVQILVPATEVAKVEKDQKAQRQAKQAPYQAARTAFLNAIRSHRLEAASQMISSLISMGEKAGQPDLTREQLVREIQDGLEILPCNPPSFNLDSDIQAVLAMCVKHNGGWAPNFPFTVTVPSGITVQAVTDHDGRAQVTLPSPSHPGVYPLVAQSEVKNFPALTQTFSYRVDGKQQTLSDGRFHEFIEAQATGNADARYTNRHQAEQIALKTARNLAYARLLEIREGLNVTSQIQLSGSYLTDSRIRSKAQGHIDAQAVTESMVWSESGPLATVVYRLPLR